MRKCKCTVRDFSERVCLRERVGERKRERGGIYDRKKLIETDRQKKRYKEAER